MQYIKSAPANIALIKYMGKQNSQTNLPANASLSFTLDHFRTEVKLSLNDKPHDEFVRCTHITHSSVTELFLSDSAKTRFIAHLNQLKTHFACQHYFTIESINNFPLGCGLASSASSFAALTRSAVTAFSELQHFAMPNDIELSTLSRQGSGSSCRSFFSPWAIWQNTHAEPISLPYKNLRHHLIVINTHEKQISSSEAHRRIQHSLLYAGRAQRAQQRLELLLNAFNQQDWEMAFRICWQEFFDMHALFETCEQPFSYIEPRTLSALAAIRQYWQQYGDGPIVTMDAGPNIHLLFHDDQLQLADHLLKDLGQHYEII